MPNRVIRHPGLRGQQGLTLIEFMVAITIGMILVAAIATLIAQQSGNRAEIDKSGRMIENGRYAVQTMQTDLQMAGYWGEIGSAPAAPGSVPDPCDTSAATLEAAMGVHVQGFDQPLATLPTSLQVCVKNHKPGTDVLVLRRVDPDTTDIETSGTVTWTLLKPGQVYLQTGLNPATSQFDWVAPTAANGTTDSSTFTRLRKNKTTPASPRKYMVHIYYVSKCSVEVSGSCTNADGGTPIPTLKRVELGVTSGAPSFSTVTIAEGIEDFQVDYSRDTTGDGVPDTDSDGNGFTANNWAEVVGVKLHVLARSLEKAGNGFADTKVYAMGSAGAASAPVSEQAFKRHLFVQSVRLVNPAGRRVF
ncbi:hypothetical protein GCM10027034_10600 [Ramlibacter solisilvae]|uniref:Pilus assembly protein PilW n=1 Tax=Ramlibacter tataouinensis TaxID=94132 RepID=A0A127JXJ4_9BURK|nr:PilW family protein [Ramlibacter tataouinensis]AMO24625.1 hypothetical protein UC35_19525 [Ramlibacter tataouinensis]